MSTEKLPEGWGVVPVSDVTTLIRGVTYKKEQAINHLKDGYLPLIRANNIQNGRFNTSDLVFVPENLVKESQKIAPEDIVIAMSSGSKTIVGKSAHQVLPFECSFGAFCGILRPEKNILPKFIAYFTQSSFYRNKISSLSAGANINNIKPSSFELISIPLPSLAEQKIIAEKLETLLAQVDSTKARLDKIPQILKRFRQAVLATAMRGKLTNLPTANNLKIKDIACVIGGLTKNSKRNSFELKVPYLRVANVYENELKLDDVTEIGVQSNELRRVSLEYEDLLIVEGNGSLDQIGRAALWRKEIQECVHQNHLIKVRANKEILYPTFLLFYLMSPQGKEEIIDRATSGAGLYTLSISKISSINVPVYSLPEQAEIVRRVEQLFAYADTIEKQVNNALTRVNNLTQSILAKAFRGELTAQWRAENPDLISGENSAAALLEKIKAERAASGSKKASRKKI